MAEYISREEILRALNKNSITKKITVVDSTSVYDTVKNIPTTDVAEVKHGEWLRTDAFPHKVFCSLCYRTYVTNEEVIQERNSQHPCYCTEAEYCPHCGAKMYRKKNDNELHL